MSLRIAFTILFAVIAVFPARSDPMGCYWDAPGLPYSMEPPRITDEPPAYRKKLSGTPAYVTAALVLSSGGGLLVKWACGVVDEQDIANARNIYRRWGCSPESSLGQMVEGLSSGGIFVSEVMTAFPIYFDAHKQEFAEFCAFIDTVPPQCFRPTPIEGEETDDRIKQMNRKLALKMPECVDKWPRFGEFEGILERPFWKDPALNEIIRRDRALLESAGVD